MLGEQSLAKRPNCNQDSSVFLIRPVGAFCPVFPFVIKPFDGDSPQSYALDRLSLSFYAEYQTFLGQKYQTAGRNSLQSIFLDLCNFDLDLWDFLFGFVGLIKLLRGGVEVGKEGTKDPP